MRRMLIGLAAASVGLALFAQPAATQPRFEEHYAQSGPVKLHYVAAGKGPLVVMLHGFPEYWGFWRGVMGELKGEYRVAAVDLRGYNLSDKPAGVAA